MRFLLTNDDGLEAPGLAALDAALPDAAEAMIVAPAEEHSACSHQVQTDAEFRTARLDERRVAVESSPADCVRVAVHDFRDRFDWVLAGINHGANLGADVYYSGTVAAAREAALHGIPAIAVSHYHNRSLATDWERASRWVRRLLAELLQRPLAQGEFWNVNLPSLPAGSTDPPLVDCEIDTSPLPLAYAVNGTSRRYEGVYKERGRQRGRDVETCFGGRIAVSRMKLP